MHPRRCLSSVSKSVVAGNRTRLHHRGRSFDPVLGSTGNSHPPPGKLRFSFGFGYCSGLIESNIALTAAAVWRSNLEHRAAAPQLQLSLPNPKCWKHNTGPQRVPAIGSSLMIQPRALAVTCNMIFELSLVAVSHNMTFELSSNYQSNCDGVSLQCNICYIYLSCHASR